jgi:hypothetical protein
MPGHFQIQKVLLISDQASLAFLFIDHPDERFGILLMARGCIFIVFQNVPLLVAGWQATI